MRKLFFSILMMMLIASILPAQTVADFECIEMVYFGGGSDDLSKLTVVPNPDKSGINTSNYVVKFDRDKDGVPWSGFYSVLPAPVDVTVNKYIHVKVWKPRITTLFFKLDGGAAGMLEVNSMSPQTSIGQWEEMVFNFSATTGTFPVIDFLPDSEYPLTLSEDIVIYFDDIILNNDPLPNTPAIDIIEDYEIMPMNMMYGGVNDSSSLTLVVNPDPSGVNQSDYVIKYHRDKDGVPWGGFWSSTGVDVTTNKYMHAKVWKPRISPLRFKIEGGADGTFEDTSALPQTTTGAWEDIVFDFSTKTGTYPTIVFMPDFSDPVNLSEDIDIYFDDIVLNNIPPALPGNSVTFEVNMSVYAQMGIFNPNVDFVDIAANFNGWDGLNYHLTTSNDSIYSILVDNFTMGDVLEFKFRINGNWSDATCEFPGGGPNRTYTVPAGTSVYSAWYNNVTEAYLGSVGGTITYDNSLSSPISDAHVKAWQNSALKGEGFTGSQGTYLIENLVNGQYLITASTQKPWGGVNSADALLVLKKFSDEINLDGMKLLAGDVNGSGYLNSTDALLIARRFVGQLNSFAAGDWLFTNEEAVVSNNSNTINLKGICVGDVNGSYETEVKEAVAASLICKGSIAPQTGHSLAIPIFVDQVAEISSVSFVMDFNADKIQIQDVTMAKGGAMVYNVIEDQLRLSWFSLEPMKLAEGEALFVIHANPRNGLTIDKLDFRIEAGTAFTDTDGDIITNMKLSYPGIQLNQESAWLGQNYPNPCTTTTIISFFIPLGSQGNLSIQDMMGREVRVLSDDVFAEGYYEIGVDMTNVTPGVYQCLLEVNGSTGVTRVVRRMVVEK